MDMDNISSIIDNLDEEDIGKLLDMASSVLKTEPSSAEKEEKAEGAGIDLEAIGKIASVMGMLSGTGNDPRCGLLFALKPFLREERRKKVDEAARMLRVLELVPKLREEGIFL